MERQGTVKVAVRLNVLLVFQVAYRDELHAFPCSGIAVGYSYPAYASYVRDTLVPAIGFVGECVMESELY